MCPLKQNSVLSGQLRNTMNSKLICTHTLNLECHSTPAQAVVAAWVKPYKNDQAELLDVLEARYKGHAVAVSGTKCSGGDTATAANASTRIQGLHLL